MALSNVLCFVHFFLFSTIMSSKSTLEYDTGYLFQAMGICQSKNNCIRIQIIILRKRCLTLRDVTPQSYIDSTNLSVVSKAKTVTKIAYSEDKVNGTLVIFFLHPMRIAICDDYYNSKTDFFEWFPHMHNYNCVAGDIIHIKYLNAFIMDRIAVIEFVEHWEKFNLQYCSLIITLMNGTIHCYHVCWRVSTSYLAKH